MSVRMNAGPPEGAAPLLSFRCLVDGVVADVAVHQDHLAWDVRPGLFVQWVRETRVVPLRIVSSVTTQRVNLLWSRVRFTAMGSAIEFQVGHDLAARIRDLVVPLVVAGPGAGAPASVASGGSSLTVGGTAAAGPAPVSAAPVPGLPPAGWYADPGGSRAWRWWNGRSWTWHTSGLAAAG